MTRKEAIASLADEYVLEEKYSLTSIKFGSWLVAKKGWYWMADNEFTYGELMNALGDRPGVEQCHVDHSKMVVS